MGKQCLFCEHTFRKLNKYVNHIKDEHRDSFIFRLINKSMKHHVMMHPYFKNLMDYLNSNDIEYYLCGGTLLGCIRDGKKIIWDDDYDIFIYSDEIKKIIGGSIEEKIKGIWTGFLFENKGVKYAIKPFMSFFCIECTFIDDGKMPTRTVTDIFHENETCYSTHITPKRDSFLMKKFHDIECKIPVNYEDELLQFYGENYMNDFVMWSHDTNIAYSNLANIKIDTDEYNLLCEEYNYS
jgi:hypothetical protein